MASNYYIGQTMPPFRDIPFGTTTIGKSGCGICAIAMVISRMANSTTTDEKKAVVQAIINQGLTGNLLRGDFTVNHGGKSYRVTTTKTKPANYNNSIIQYNGHFVVAVNNNTVEDPGTTSITTVSAANAKYGAHNKYWLISTPFELVTKPLYRVQLGAFQKLENAQALQKRLQVLGYDAFIRKEGILYRVQVGAFRERANANTLAAKLKVQGFNTFIATVEV